MIKTLYGKYKSVILYLFFGGCTTLVNIVTYNSLYYLCHVTNVVSNIIAWILSVLFAFITNKIWVFESKKFDLKILSHEIPTFFGARLVTGLMDLAIMFVSVDVLHLNAMLWKIISNILVIVLNYVASKFIIFKKDDYFMFEKIVKNIIKYIFLILFILILFIDICFSSINYFCKKEFLIPNFIIVLLAIVIIGLGYFLKYKTKARNIKIRSNNLILILTLILFVLEVYVANNVYFKTGWDVGVINSAAQAIAVKNNEIVINSSSYFSHYPNNIIITLLFSLIIHIHTMIGFIQPGDGYFGIIIFQCFLFALTGLLIYRIIAAYTRSNKYAYLGWIFYVVLLGLSAWYVIPYSDGTGLIFPVLILYIYQKLDNQKLTIVKWGLIILLSYWGYRIKPQVIIILIAIIIVELIKFFSSSIDLKMIKKKIIVLLTCVFVGVFSIKTNESLVHKSGFVINKEDNIGVIHFLKMGLNNTKDGVYNQEDVDYSMSIPSAKERNRLNIKIIKKRLNNYGMNGLAKHVIKKTLVNFNDGTFAWGVEGHFYNEMKTDVNTTVAPRLKKIYYNDGKYYKYLSTLEQMFWIVSLILLLGICFSKSNDNVLFVILLSLIGITVFELIFEARARYFIVYVPLFITCAMIGLREIMNFRIKKEG